MDFIFTEREKEKILRLFNKEASKNASPEYVKKIRELVRLYVALWFAARVINRGGGTPLNPSAIAGSVCGSIIGMRTVFRLVKLIGAKINELDWPSHAPTAGPALGGALAGLLGGVILARGLPLSISGPLTVFLGTKSCEWLYNWTESSGKLRWKPDWLGIWVLYPVAYSYLLNQLFTSPESTPMSFKRIVGFLSNGELPSNDDSLYSSVRVAASQLPVRYHSSLVSPDSIATISTVFNNQTKNQIISPEAVARLVVAHPGNKSMVGALLHPSQASGFNTAVSQFWQSVLRMSKYMVPLYAAKTVLAPSSSANSATPSRAFESVVRSILAYSLNSATMLAGIELSTKLMGRSKTNNALRFHLVGLVSGLSVYINRQSGRGQHLYAVRLAVLSLLFTGKPEKYQRSFVNKFLPPALAIALAVLNTLPGATSNIYRILGKYMQGNNPPLTSKDSEENES